MAEVIRFLSDKHQDSVTREWDKIAPVRDEQLARNADASYSEVLEPWILGRLPGEGRVIDVGCGTGRLTSSIKSSSISVTGIDPSEKSIELARVHDAESDYVVSTAEKWATENPDERFDVAVANMVLMDTLDIESTCKAIASFARGGRVLATISHPAFWPLYWGYAGNVGFDYTKELIVEAPFRTSSFDFALPATHVHRPVSMYLHVLRQVGIDVIGLDELRGPEDTDSFPFPRFLAIEASVPEGG